MFEKLPNEVLLIILNNLSEKDLYNFSQVSKEAYEVSHDTEFVKAKKEIEKAIKILKEYNPHDLYKEAVQKEKVAMLVVSTPELLKEFYDKGHKQIFGHNYATPKLDKRYEKKNQPEDAYAMDVDRPLLFILIEHPKAAKMLFKNDLIDAKTKEIFKQDLEFIENYRKANPS